MRIVFDELKWHCQFIGTNIVEQRELAQCLDLLCILRLLAPFGLGYVTLFDPALSKPPPHRSPLVERPHEPRHTGPSPDRIERTSNTNVSSPKIYVLGASFIPGVCLHSWELRPSFSKPIFRAFLNEPTELHETVHKS